METITLSLPERLILANQFQILAARNPAEAEDYKKLITIAERGFSEQYGRLFEGFDRVGLTLEQCEYVGQVLDTFWCIQDSYDGLADKAGLEPADVVFPGFDGNNELSFITYAKFRLNDGDFKGLRYVPGLNAHRPTESRYCRVVQRYESTTAGTHSHELSAAQIRAVLEI